MRVQRADSIIGGGEHLRVRRVNRSAHRNGRTFLAWSTASLKRRLPTEHDPTNRGARMGVVAQLGFVVAMLANPNAAIAKPASAHDLVAGGIAAQGGRERLQAIRAVQLETTGYRNMLEQSERPTGPYIPQFQTSAEIRDHEHGDFRETSSFAIYDNGEGAEQGNSTIVVADGVAMRRTGTNNAPADAVQVRLAAERLALSPERLLLTALNATDLKRDADVTMQGFPQQVVSFTLDGAPVRIYLNPYTHLPTAYDYSGPLARTGFWAYHGDATERTFLSFWKLTPQGIRLPLQSDVQTNGLPDRTYVISRLTLNPNLSGADFHIPAEVKARFKPVSSASLETVPLDLASVPPQELAPGIVLIRGPWNVTLVRQNDGIVVLDGPISSGYSAKVIEQAHRRFPGVPIKAVVSTSDAWPHIAGLREYVALGIPIFILDLNKAAVQSIIRAPHRSGPDRLQAHPKSEMLRIVSSKAILGRGKNRLEIYPVRGESSERQMMVYFPAHHLLYGSDIFQQDQNGKFTFPEQVLELSEAVDREGLVVDRVFLMHVGATPWSEVISSANARAEENGPSASAGH
jgi:hypothetical protein